MSEEVPNAFTQIDQQVAAGQPATVLVERNNGETIATAQVMGTGENRTNVFYGDLSDGPKAGMAYKSVGNERLTDEYQAKLAEKLAGKALLGGGVELNTDTVPRSTVAKESQNPYDRLVDPSLSDEEFAAEQSRVSQLDMRSPEKKAADQESQALEEARQKQNEANHRYSMARQAGATHEEAERSANRIYRS